jgi:phenylalanyl-tRNA synthetase alpha chain
MTANELEFLKAGKRAFLIAGDVYRRDQIDFAHYPVFHQLEGVKVISAADDIDNCSLVDSFNEFGIKYNWETQPNQNDLLLRRVTDDLYHKLTGLMRFLFGPQILIRWQTCHFPFTCPSFEIEILHRDRWIEVCGSGILQASILEQAGIDSKSHSAWAFGLGLERLAMILFDIPDIRLFWSQDERFLSQFQGEEGAQARFQPFSKYPAARRDLSFWLVEVDTTRARDEFSENGMFDLIREIGGDLIEDVSLVKGCVGIKNTC